MGRASSTQASSSCAERSEESFARLHFRMPFRRYQQMALDVVEGKLQAQTRFHIVAPPGSGKTIVGLELIRRWGRPALVLSPTTTIQRQWREKLGLFTDDPAWVETHTSMDAGHLAEMSFLTYQVLSTPGENLEFAERIAIDQWVEDLLASDRASGEAPARERIEHLRRDNPPAFRREVSKRYVRVKRELLRGGSFDGRQLLHSNAQDLISRLVALGIGTIILDECHHLLDYWAFILRELIKALPGVRVVGLTATLPDSESRQAYENYLSLLGEVDFEVPTPAVVKEGNLAPYRDLVYFCEPSPREHAYLRNIQEHFEAAILQVTASPAFGEWLRGLLLERRPAGLASNEPPEPFSVVFNREPLLCIAGIKALLAQGVALPADIPLVEEMSEPLTVDDWLTLLERFGLEVLKMSPDRELQQLYQELKRVLLGFGVTISERGIRHQRSPGDLVLALSESKDRATVELLRAEAQALGPLLRAVVITDYERMSAHARQLQDVLDPDAGSAVRVFRHLVADPETQKLSPVLVTGGVVLANVGHRAVMEAGIRRWRDEQKASFTWEWLPTDDPQIVQLAGSGKDWSSRTYVACVTRLFEQGMTRCLVGTRGIFGEGWDALTLNTLVDLTSVTTSTGVQQIRGRTIRLDPAWPRKVAHNWDVVCYSRRFDKGFSDLARFIARHEHTWGIIVRRKRSELVAAVDQAMQGFSEDTPLAGRVVRGVAHVDLKLAQELALRPLKLIDYAQYTRQMLSAVSERDLVYELWAVGAPYSNFSYSATHIEAEDLKFRTAYTVEASLRTMVRRVLVSVLAVVALILCNLLYVLPAFDALALPVVGALLAGALALAVVLALGVNARAIWRVFRRAFVEMPVDDILLDIARALLGALRDTGLVSSSLTDAYVRVVQTDTGGFEVFVDYASPEDSNVFSQAYRELLGPLGDARYLVERDSSSLRNPLYRAVWRSVRGAMGLAQDARTYHPVPAILASRRERAASLARHWQRYVGGGRLIYTRTEEGRQILLQARAQRRTPIRQMAFETWR